MDLTNMHNFPYLETKRCKGVYELLKTQFNEELCLKSPMKRSWYRKKLSEIYTKHDKLICTGMDFMDRTHTDIKTNN